jgi:ribosomal protein L31E
MKSARWKRTKKAVIALRVFLVKHMKSENVSLSKEVNEEMWKHGIKNPPHHIKVTVTKDEKGAVRAELYGSKKVSKKEDKKTSKKEIKKEAVTEKKIESQPEKVKETKVKTVEPVEKVKTQ